MHLLILLCLGGLLASAAADDIQMMVDYDTEPALKDEAKWKVIFNCFMGTEPCGKLQAIKDAAIRVYNNKCEKCTPQQKETFETKLKLAIDKYPNDVAEILNKFANAG